MKKPTFQRIRLWIISCLVLSLIGFGGGYLYWSVFDYRFYTVTEGKVYRSGQMPADKLKEKVDSYGIKTIIDLRKSEDQALIEAEHQAMSAINVNHINLPSNQVPQDEIVMDFLEIMKNPANLPVLIHCHHGEGRAVLFSAIYRIEFEGWDNESARRASRFILWNSSFDTDRTKGMYLQKYDPRLKFQQ